MKRILSKRVHIAWLLMSIILTGAIGIVWKVGVLDPPAANSILINGEAAPGPGVSQISQNTSGQPTRIAEASSLTGHPTSTAESSIQAVQLKADTAVPLPDSGQPTAAPTLEATAQPTPTPEMVAVYVSGGVHKPGLYSLPIGSRVDDAVMAAGGPTDNADMERVNLAARISDEEHISIPRIGDTPTPNTPITASKPTPRAQQTGGPSSYPTRQSVPTPTGPININTASAQELETIPGIGPALASRIVAYRKDNGPFTAVEDLMNIPGIKEGIFARMKDYVTVR